MIIVYYDIQGVRVETDGSYPRFVYVLQQLTEITDFGLNMYTKHENYRPLSKKKHV